MERRIYQRLVFLSALLATWMFMVSPAFADFFPIGETFETSRFSDEKIQLLAPTDTGNRPPLIFEGGDLFLGTGVIFRKALKPLGGRFGSRNYGFSEPFEHRFIISTMVSVHLPRNGLPD